MSPVKIELCNQVFIVEDKKTEGFRLFEADIGIICRTTEDGGNVLFVRKTNNLNSCHGYENAGTINIAKGDEPIIKEIQCRYKNGNKKDLKTKITAF